jgi:hypothetical protein
MILCGFHSLGLVIKPPADLAAGEALVVVLRAREQVRVQPLRAEPSSIHSDAAKWRNAWKLNNGSPLSSTSPACLWPIFDTTAPAHRSF